MRICVSFHRAVDYTTGIHVVEAFWGLGHDVTWAVPGSEPDGHDLIVRVDDGHWAVAHEPRHRPAIFWSIDTAPNESRAVQLGHDYDRTFDGNKLLCDLHTPRATWMPLACPKGDIPVEWSDGGRDIDVGCFGSPTLGRPAIFAALRSAGLRAILASGSSAERGAFNRRCKMVLNHVPHGYLNMRTFEGPGAGAVLLQTHHDHLIEGSGLRECFPDGGVVLARPEDYIDVARDLLGDVDRRVHEARMGWRTVRQRHTYHHRAAQLLGAVRDLLG